REAAAKGCDVRHATRCHPPQSSIFGIPTFCDRRHSGARRLEASCGQSSKEDSMNSMQTSLHTARDTKLMRKVQDSIVQAGVGFCLFSVIAIFGMVIVSQAIGQENFKERMIQKAPVAQANVLPQLVIWNDALEPGLTGMLATGDGGAAIDTSETGNNN